MILIGRTNQYSSLSKSIQYALFKLDFIQKVILYYFHIDERIAALYAFYNFLIRRLYTTTPLRRTIMKILSTAILILTTVLLLSASVFITTAPAYAAGDVVEFKDTDGDGVLSRRECNAQKSAARGQNKAAYTAVVSGNVKKIDDQAFLLSDGLTGINLPASVTTLGRIPFDLCKNLTSITVDGSNTVFASRDGMLYSKDYKAFVAYPSAHPNKTFVLPDTVSTIRFGAFCRTGLQSITLPAGLKIIEDSALEECVSLKTIKFPDGITKIGMSAFNQCGALTGDLLLPKSLKDIGPQSFRLTGIKSVTIASDANIRGMTFLGCHNLDTVNITGNLTQIGNSSFGSCTALKNINLPKSLKVIYWLAFSGCTSLPEIILPDGLVQLGKKGDVDGDQRVVDDYADGERGVFNGCTSLKSIVIPDSVEYVEAFSFYGCISLKTVKLSLNPKCNVIKDRTFLNCSSLQSITIPKNILELESGAFENSGLTQLTIVPNGCRIIGEGAFSVNKNLKEVNLPVGVTTLSYMSFADCDSLKTVTISSTIKLIPPFVFYNVPALTRLNIISTAKPEIAPFNFEDAAFIKSGQIHVPQNWTGGAKIKIGKVIKDLPAVVKR